MLGSKDGLLTSELLELGAVANGVVLLPLLNELRNSINLLVVGSGLGLTRFFTESLAAVTSESALCSTVAAGLVAAAGVVAVEVGEVNDTLGLDSVFTGVIFAAALVEVVLVAVGDFKVLGAAVETGVFAAASSFASVAAILLFDLMNGLFKINEPLVDGDGAGLVDVSVVAGAVVLVGGAAAFSV